MTEQDETQKRWTAKRRSALVPEILRGAGSIVEAARKQDLTVAEIEAWRDRFLSDVENALRRRSFHACLALCCLHFCFC